MIQVFRPSITEREVEAVSEVLRSGWLGLGPKTAEFETKFADYVGAEYAIGTNSATAALHLVLAALGIGPGDEVLVPTMTFVSTAHAVLYCGATPVFVDIEPDTLNIDLEDAECRITKRTRAIVPVHYGGHACQMNELWQMADAHDLLVVEDAAHACGGQYYGQRVGSLRSTATCFSFHAVKNLTCGDGGMITTNQPELVHTLKRLRWCGIDKSTWDRARAVGASRDRYSHYGWYYEVHELGYKYHMNDIMAAIGLVQLDRLENTNARRREIVTQYNTAFAHMDWLECPVEHDYTTSAHHNYVIKTPHRDALNLYLRERDIATGVHYMPVHLHPYYRNRYWTSLPVAEDVWTCLLTLPLYPDLTEDEVECVIQSILDFGETL